jgi:hypothetical protein
MSGCSNPKTVIMRMMGLKISWQQVQVLQVLLQHARKL